MPIINSYTIDRGRSSELARTDTGTATIKMIDTNGSLDPASGGSSYDPMTPIAIALGGAPIFTGHVARWSYDLYPNMRYGIATIECVDALDILAATEMTSNSVWGNSNTANNNIWFEAHDQV